MNQNKSVDMALIHKVRDLLPQFYAVVETLIFAREIRCLNKITDDGFLRSLELSLIGTTVCDWYKLFDITGGDGSWKQFTVENKDYRDQIYDATGFNYQQWSAFRTKMGSLRNEIFSNANKLTAASRVSDEDIENLLTILRISYRWLCAHANDPEYGAIDIFRAEDFIDFFIDTAKIRFESLIKQ